MSPNSDNAMARFLFAILKQKNLKDIDWNQVAEDPVLLQPITNGHAARMRYSRFRSTILGHEPQKRSRNPEKSRVSKPKKGSTGRKDSVIKSESGVSLSSLAQFSPASTTSPYLNDRVDDFGHRFLTPCSDDMAHNLSMNRGAPSFGGLDNQPDFMHDSGSLSNSPALDAFDSVYDLSSYSNGPIDVHSQDTRDLNGNPALIAGDWSENYPGESLF